MECSKDSDVQTFPGIYKEVAISVGRRHSSHNPEMGGPRGSCTFQGPELELGHILTSVYRVAIGWRKLGSTGRDELIFLILYGVLLHLVRRR